MAVAVTMRSALRPVGLAALVVILGGLVVVQPMLALAAAGAVVLLAVARAPLVWLLAGVIALTAIVPFASQQTFSVGGGVGAPGLLPSDVLLVAALVAAVPKLLRMRLDPRTAMGAGLVAAFVALAAVQLVRGLVIGRDASAVGSEFRVLLGFSTFLATVVVLDDERERTRLFQLLAVIGLALGLWGLGQWVFNIQFSQAADAGVRTGINFTTAGRGQLQGGLYVFPAAILLALGVLVAGGVRSARARLLLQAVIVLNVVCLVLTYERTFWVAVAVAAAVLVVRAGAAQRFRAIAWGSLALVLTFAALATLAPSTLTAARERLFSIGQYRSDFSLRYRVVEAHHVAEQIRHSPVTGSGFDSRVVFARPWDLVPAQSYTFAHNGYLWLAWRLGIPTAALLIALLWWCIARLKRRFGRGVLAGIQFGARAALLALALICVTFPIFNQLSVTPTMGMLMAIAVSANVVGARTAEPDSLTAWAGAA